MCRRSQWNDVQQAPPESGPDAASAYAGADKWEEAVDECIQHGAVSR